MLPKCAVIGIGAGGKYTLWRWEC